MIDLTLRLNESAASKAVAAGGNSSSSASATSSTSSQSFASELSAAISQALSQFGINPSTVQLTVDDTGSQNSGASQNSVSSSGSTVISNTASPVTPVAVSPAATQTSSTQPAEAPTVSTQSTSATTESTASNSPIVLGSAADAAYDAAYWAAQPAAVQQLQNIQDPEQRTELATQLANEGYTIDVPIMVWGWDPGTTMQLRESYGYTWVPSALQQPVTAAPGITGPGIVPYEPNDPPAGSIPV